MKTFRIGDKVVVCSKDFAIQNGLIGEIIDIATGGSLPIHIRYDEGQQDHPYMIRFGDIAGNTYSHDDLLHGDYPPTMEDTRSYLDAVAK